jgi:hypothetical protein
LWAIGCENIRSFRPAFDYSLRDQESAQTSSCRGEQTTGRRIFRLGDNRPIMSGRQQGPMAFPGKAFSFRVQPGPERASIDWLEIAWYGARA